MDIKVLRSISNFNDPLDQVFTDLKQGPSLALVLNLAFPFSKYVSTLKISCTSPVATTFTYYTCVK